MKKTLTIIFFLSILVNSSYTQIVKSVALKGGVVWTDQDWEFDFYSTSEQNYRLEYTVGANVEFFQNKFLSMIVEGGFIRKGYQTKTEITTSSQPEGTGEYWESNFIYKYIYLSPMLKFRIEFGHFVPFVHFGPRADFYLSYEMNEWVYFDERLEDFTEKVVWGINYGGGIEYMFGPAGVFMSFTHQYDFSLAFDIGYSGSVSSIKNNAFVLGFGLKYYFGAKK